MEDDCIVKKSLAEFPQFLLKSYSNTITLYFSRIANDFNTVGNVQFGHYDSLESHDSSIKYF